MALTTTQVNQAFLGLLGRPATGAEAAKFAGQLDAATLAQTLLTDASFKNELSVETLSFKTVDLLNTDPAAFVESLYTALLGRASDAEGKAFWLSVAGATPNRADVVSQFIAAVQSQEGTADANAFATIQAEDKALANAWVESLYNNLAGRASDAEGLDFWTNAIVSFAMTPAQVAASFAAALALQGNTTEDGQNYLAKLGVADNFTANFKDFNALITANEKAEQLKNLVTMMNGVNKDSQVDQYTQEITKITDEYQKIAAVQFTSADDDNLGIDPETGESNLKGAANFTGTYNLTDATKGTIQSSDSATGTEAYLTDTLTVNVTGYDKTTHDTFNLSELPSTSSVEKLVINNGAANVNGGSEDTAGSINGDFQYINVNGTGSFNITANTSNTDGLKDIVLNSASGKDNTFVNQAGNLVSIKTGAGNDTIKAGYVSKSLNVGAGKDDVTASLGKGATADLGAGDDKFSGYLGESSKLQAGAGDDEVTITGAWSDTDKKDNPISNIEIDLGTGDDKLDLSTTVDTNFTGISSIKGTETIKVGTGTTLVASAVSGQKIALEGDSLVLDAATANNVDLSKFTNLDGNDVKVTINNVKTGTINLETGDKNFNAIKETIVLAKDAGKVTIKGLESANDKIEIAGTKVNNAAFFGKDAAGTTTGVNTANVFADNIYFVNLKEKVTKAEINKLLTENNAKFNIAEKGVFYIVATDSATDGDNRSSAAKVFKIEVGKDGKVAKLDQTSSITVANKGVLQTTDFVQKSDSYAFSETASGASAIYTLNDTKYSGDNIKVDATGVDSGATITLQSGASTQDATITTNSGQNINVIVTQSLKSLTTTAGNDEINLTATINELKTGDGKDVITVADVASGATSIDGGSGDDTLKLGAVNTKIEKLSSIEIIDVTTANAGLKASAISDLTTKVTGDKNFTVDADNATVINLSDVTFTTTGTVTVDKVGADAVVTLKANDNKAETIKLADVAKGSVVTIENAKTAEDTIDLSGANTAITANGGWDTDMSFEDTKAYMVTANKAVDKIVASDVIAGITVGGSSGNSGQVFVKGTDGIAVYTITVNAASTGFDVGTTADLVLMGIQGLEKTDITIA